MGFAVGARESEWRESEWSDYAPIAVRISWKGSLPNQKILGKRKSRAVPFELPSETELDRMLIEVVHSRKQDPKSPTALVYGSIPTN